MPHIPSSAVNNSYSQRDSGNLPRPLLGYRIKSVPGGRAQIDWRAAKRYISTLSDLLDFRTAHLPLQMPLGARQARLDGCRDNAHTENCNYLGDEWCTCGAIDPRKAQQRVQQAQAFAEIAKHGAA